MSNTAQTIEHESCSVVETGSLPVETQNTHGLAERKQEVGSVSSLIEMAINADLDIEKLERLMEMKEREENKTSYAAFVVAISRFQAECPTVKKTGMVKDKNGKQIYSYPKFDSIMKTIQPHLEKNSLSVRFNSEISDNSVKVLCMVSHAGGHTDESSFSCPIEGHMAGGANASQRTASANSFAKRYAIMNALNIAGSDYDDDDAQILGEPPETITKEQAAQFRDDLEALKADVGYFCKWMKVDELEDIPAKKFNIARNAIIEQKKAAQK